MTRPRAGNIKLKLVLIRDDGSKDCFDLTNPKDRQRLDTEGSGQAFLIFRRPLFREDRAHHNLESFISESGEAVLDIYEVRIRLQKES